MKKIKKIFRILSVLLMMLLKIKNLKIFYIIKRCTIRSLVYPINLTWKMQSDIALKKQDRKKKVLDYCLLILIDLKILMIHWVIALVTKYYVYSAND